MAKLSSGAAGTKPPAGCFSLFGSRPMPDADVAPFESRRTSDADAARYRRAAEECRSVAAKTVNVLEKDAFLRLADEWLKLAQVRP
jgi:hypothetical protein